MLNYATLFKVSFARATDGDLRDRFFSRFYERFMGSSSEVAALFRETDLKQQEEMLAGSLSEMMDFFVTHESNPYIVTLARIHGVRGRQIPPVMYSLWLEALLDTVAELDPEHTPEVDLAWRIVMAPGIEFMKHYYGR